MNGKLVVGAGRSELARLLAVAPDAAQLVVLRRNDSLAALRTLRSDNIRLTHRISYLEEQVRDLLAPRTEISADLELASSASSAAQQPQLQVSIYSAYSGITSPRLSLSFLHWKRRSIEKEKLAYLD